MSEYRSHDEEIRAMLKQAQDERDIALEDAMAFEDQLKTATETIQRLRSERVVEILKREAEVCRCKDPQAAENYCSACGKPLEVVE